MLLLLLACTGEEPDDDEPEEDSGEAIDTSTGCEVVELRYDGPEEPRVGDSWDLSLYCDDAYMMGAAHIYLDPVEFATIEEDTTTITFAQAGDGTVTLQVGNKRDSVDVTVAE